MRCGAARLRGSPVRRPSGARVACAARVGDVGRAPVRSVPADGQETGEMAGQRMRRVVVVIGALLAIGVLAASAAGEHNVLELISTGPAGGNGAAASEFAARRPMGRACSSIPLSRWSVRTPMRGSTSMSVRAGRRR